MRELISNASDAIDKLYYQALSDNLSDVDTSGFKIYLEADKENRTLTIRDNGLGMNKDELEDNLGTIAKSWRLWRLSRRWKMQRRRMMWISSDSLVSASILHLWLPAVWR